jgi:hypothetical protein
VWRHYVDRIVGTGLGMSRQVFDRAVARGEIGPGLDIDALVAAFVGGLQMTTEADPRMRPPSKAAREALVQVVLLACRGSLTPGVISDPGTRAAASRGTPAGLPARRRRG